MSVVLTLWYVRSYWSETEQVARFSLIPTVGKYNWQIQLVTTSGICNWPIQVARPVVIVTIDRWHMQLADTRGKASC